MPNTIIHFEIPADDLDRARGFYKAALGWKITDPWKMEYLLVETKKEGEAGINGGLMKRKMAGQPFMNYINVPSIEKARVKVEAAGGKLYLAKQEVGPGMGWFALFEDTEGNVLGLHQAPKTMPTAKKPAAKKAAKKAPKKKAKKKAKRR